ncbi:hypothetical protein E2C01_003022 [Portunus trituberculatus]|uniref:Uncharacterized protein n=1 Tax=Portunus trituberculatus TaxID=210409 RepID=A0A5B7CMW0_PORTR|nr:hypothetical protein [Portunus trituberculatus]
MTPKSDEYKESGESASLSEPQHSIRGFTGITSREKLHQTFSWMVTHPPVTSLLLPIVLPSSSKSPAFTYELEQEQMLPLHSAGYFSGPSTADMSFWQEPHRKKQMTLDALLGHVLTKSHNSATQDQTSRQVLSRQSTAPR